jgi:cytidylate kinase
LVRAADAELLDTSSMNLEDQIQWVVDLVQQRVNELQKKGHFDKDEA